MPLLSRSLWENREWKLKKNNISIFLARKSVFLQYWRVQTWNLYNVEGYKRDTFTMLKGTNVTPLQCWRVQTWNLYNVEGYKRDTFTMLKGKTWHLYNIEGYKRDTFTILYLKIYDILLKINQVYKKNSAAVLPDMK